MPITGNMLLFRDRHMFSHEVLVKLGQQFHGVFSFFFGHKSAVIVTDPDACVQVLKRHQFAGRPDFGARDMMFHRQSCKGLTLTDFGQDWEAFRKVAHTAVRRYASGSDISRHVIDVVDRLMEQVGEQPFNCRHHTNLIMTAVMGQAAYGKRYQLNDQQLQHWWSTVDLLQVTTPERIMMFLMPVYKWIFRPSYRKQMTAIHWQQAMGERSFKEATSASDAGSKNTFACQMATAAAEAHESGSWLSQHLTPDSLHNVVTDVVRAGIDTTSFMMTWMLLLVCSRQQHHWQERMRHEIMQVIGNRRKPTIADRTRCHQVCAFISETLRFRNLEANGVPHKATVDQQVNGQVIKAGTMVIVSMHAMMHHETIWKDAQQFSPDRFLDCNGCFVSKPNQYYLPFGDGRRSCPGNKMAINVMFLVMARLLQRTLNMSVDGGVTERLTRGDLSQTNGWAPPDYHLRLMVYK